MRGSARVVTLRSPRLRPRIAGEALTLVWLLWAYDQIRSHTEVRRGAAITSGRWLLHLEQLLHVDVERRLNAWTASHPLWNLLAASWHQYAHLSVTVTVLAWCWWRRPELYRWARTSLVLVNVLGLATFLLFPVAPPRLLPGQGFVDSSVLAGFSSGRLGPVHADEYGAMPSLHVAWAVWVAVVCLYAAAGRRSARLWLLYPAVTSTVVLVTGNHYVLDVLAGAAAAALALVHARLLPARRAAAECDHTVLAAQDREVVTA